jgi:hypothetical protein
MKKVLIKSRIFISSVDGTLIDSDVAGRTSTSKGA